MNFIEAIAAQNKDVPAVMPLDMFSYLLGKSQASPTKTITGVPPFTFKSNGNNLIDWSIKGNAGGVGERTKNILQIPEINKTVNGVTFVSRPEAGIITANGTATGGVGIINFAFFIMQGSYRFTCRADSHRDVTFDSYLRAGSTTYARDNPDDPPGQFFTLTNNKTIVLYIRITQGYTAENLIFTPMLQIDTGDTSDVFEPYGFKIPVICGGETTNIFIGDSPLGVDDTVSKTSTGVDIPTTDGSNTLTVDTYVQPSEMTITYHR